MKALLIFLTAAGVAGTGHSQLYVQKGATLHLTGGSTIYIEGDVEAHSPLSGTGNVSLIGKSPQTIRSLTVSDLILDNDVGASLAGDLNVTHELKLLRGNLSLNDNNLALSENASIVAAGKNGIETNASGVINKKINADQSFAVPLISSGNYTPLLLTTAGRYHNAFVTISSKARTSPNRPTGANDYLNNFWIVGRSGIDGSVKALVSYSDQTTITGDLNALQGFYWDSRKWNIADNSFSAAQRCIRANITGNGGEITAMSAGNSLYARPLVLTPNPAKSFTLLNISSVENAGALISISDARGRIVRTQTIKLNKGWNQYNVNVSGLTNGYYDVTVYHSGKKTSLKLIKN
jgi:hypothetical protein